ncbi:MAG: lipopolysaccharide biosynthesis protein [Bacteroidales bacterium]
MRKRKKNTFISYFFTLISGAFIAQLISFSLMPLLTRIYSEEAFGWYASYGAMVAIVSSVATLKYESAIVLPRKKCDARILFLLSSRLMWAICFLACLILFIPLPYFDKYHGLEVAIFLGAILLVQYNMHILWNIRLRKFGWITYARILQSISIFGFQYILYYFFQFRGLVAGNILGAAAATLFLSYRRRKNLKHSIYISRNDLMRVAKRYKDFPRYFCWSNVLMSFSKNLPVLLFVEFIPLSQLGLYLLAIRILSQPSILISRNMRSVILSYMSRFRQYNIPILRWYLQLMLWLFLISVCICICIIFWGPQMVNFIFGASWQKAGIYLQMLIPFFIAQMISAPASVAIRVFEMQKYSLFYSILSLVIRSILLLFLFYKSIPFVQIILYYSCVSLLLQGVNNVFTLRKIWKYEKQ